MVVIWGCTHFTSPQSPHHGEKSKAHGKRSEGMTKREALKEHGWDSSELQVSLESGDMYEKHGAFWWKPRLISQEMNVRTEKLKNEAPENFTSLEDSEEMTGRINNVYRDGFEAFEIWKLAECGLVEIKIQCVVAARHAPNFAW